MRELAAILFIYFLAGCTPQTDDEQAIVDSQQLQPVASATSHATDQPTPALPGWAPSQACSFIGKNFGVEIHPYKYVVDEYSCSTPYKALQEGQGLPNNLPYYVTGKRDLATEIELVLNVNEPNKKAYAQEQLRKFSAVVAKAATGIELPSDISSAIMEGTPKIHEAAGYKEELTRDDWPTGRGYELHYIVTKTGED